MIQLLATRYSRHIAYYLFLIFCSSAVPVYAGGITLNGHAWRNSTSGSKINHGSADASRLRGEQSIRQKGLHAPMTMDLNPEKNNLSEEKQDIGGPSQPEMSSFKSVGSDNMVNLFTGDFSYNIPLLDVGGYPVNIFYDGGVSPEQEATWVGLGWNINPGNVSRNMRGVPDDFNGEDTLTQLQVMKSNVTWGVSGNVDLELLGFKTLSKFISTVNLGVSFNNYLGPAMDFGFKNGASFQLGPKVAPEKSSSDTNTSLRLAINLGVSVNANSRYGLTVSPSVGMTATAFNTGQTLAGGLRLSTSYNSRNGIKELQLAEQMNYNYSIAKSGKSANHSFSNSYLNSSISFAKPSYIPALRMPLTNRAWAVHMQMGSGFSGTYPSTELEIYKQVSEVDPKDQEQKKLLFGYLYYQKAKNNSNAVLDFTRFNDNEVMAETPVISAPQYSYDVFSIQGEGTGGSIRAYRNDMGTVHDNTTISKDKNTSTGADIGFPGHFGANFTTIKTPTSIGEWQTNNKLRDLEGFKSNKDTVEQIYFRNPGETSVLNKNQFDKIGGTDPVRFKLGGTDRAPAIDPALERFSKDDKLIGTTTVTVADQPERKKRTQVTTFLTAEEATFVGLDTTIRNYSPSSILDENNNLNYESISRVSSYRKKHHISQVSVSEANGRRYVYGIPVYNITQKDFTFSVEGQEIKTGKDANSDKVAIASHEPSTLNENKDGYLQTTTMPAYAHSFLLSGLLSPDYVDVTGNGITEDDLGSAVKFNYSKYDNHKWRTPLSDTRIANFNAGNRTETRDDKGLISYGERESWYMHSIESKNMIAIFTLEDRQDGKGATDDQSGINSSDHSLKRLKKIDLYNKADLKQNGITGALPVKTAWFWYSYNLCSGTPDNTNGDGKLTLDSLTFTFNGKSKSNKSKYVFAYGNGSGSNPVYTPGSSDRWGTYKPASMNPAPAPPGTVMKNSDYPYSIQDKAKKDQIDANAGAWGLTKILLPSGGQIEVKYESDDYAYVQNKRAADMMQIIGLGKVPDNITDKFYSQGFNILGVNDLKYHNYVFVKVPEPCAGKTEVFRKYLDGIEQLAFKLAVNMPNGKEYVSCYATIADYGKYGKNGSDTIWIKLNEMAGISPLALASFEYLREKLPGQAYDSYDLSDEGSWQQVASLFEGVGKSFITAFSTPIEQFVSARKAWIMYPAESFVRLNDPDGFKYGGGHRVKSVLMKDNWQSMTDQYTSKYGQEYDYTTTETFNGSTRKISSGVASYEPSIGGEENPFRTIMQVADKLPLGPASYGAIEMPLLDAFFPAPGVGYSKVTVRSIKKNLPAGKQSRSGVGKQVTEFFTAKDFPVYYQNTPLSEKQKHESSTTAFLVKYAFDSRALSQGFLVATNDMHGKMKSQSSYAENDTVTRINYTENFYRNTGSKGLDEKFDFVYGYKAGAIEEGNMGIDIELMTDTREFSVKTRSREIQGQVDAFPFIPGLPFIWGVFGNSENTYRAVTTTKTISYHAILDSVVVIDKGSRVTTRNLIYDSETGNVVVSRTNNEFDKPLYSINYPAYWAYSGMGLAYKNIDAIYTNVNFRDGRITSGNVPFAALESGDELFILNPGAPPADCSADRVSLSSLRLIWVFNKNKNTQSLTDNSPEYVFMDQAGKLYNRDGVSFRIIRSGKRNLLDASAGSIVAAKDPVTGVGTNRKLGIDNLFVINGSAVEYREKWQTDNEVINKVKIVSDENECFKEIIACDGTLETHINPYRKGLLGNFKPSRSMVFYDERQENDPLASTNLVKNGFLKNFQFYWSFQSSGNLIPVASPKWVWNSQVTRFNARGMELETQDALNIFTSAQYGYKKTLPVAIANNSPYSEMFFESFEDKDYAERINPGQQVICETKHIDFANMSNSSIIPAEYSTIQPHTGRYMLQVNSGTAVKTFPVKNAIDDYSLFMAKDTAKGLFNVGGNVDNVWTYPVDMQISPNNFLFNGAGGSVIVFPKDTFTFSGSSVYRAHNFSVNSSYYVQVPENGYYPVALSLSYVGEGASDDAINFVIRSLDDVFIHNVFATSSTPNVNEEIYLCKGIYKIEVLLTSNYWAETSQPVQVAQNNTFTFSIGLNQGYKNLSTQSGCIFTQPIAATDSMLNPVFAIPANKKMLFSAWVREDCPGGQSSCTNEVGVAYTVGGSQVIDTPIKPSGPVIEGWQRYEGLFTAPANATNMTLKFVNGSSSPIYFDDIRIHPFNANMKSYVYDPVNLRLVAELDANNYASFYEYDEEGTLIRTKAETREGVKTINETRSFKQTEIKQVQP